MKKQLNLLVLAAALAGCDTSPEVITGGPADPRGGAELANAVANVQLPPSIVASHKYRCGDNSVLSVDWLSDGKVSSARVTPEGGSGVNVAQAEAGGDYTAEGTTLKGDPKASEITFNGKSCKK
ncbi:hypothetical protein G7076_09305 [Sphingomonas sp. HDW15A]|uniref:hypothetical protein n=1 Tax=Sphingomonas sp. HDW15A TaxID=2714942 RepID=UPI00140D0936|nr:hypothetical protein [Sphingomonas sp. HDW15A]QIK96605.1 hypothetical protein G7076_09305 [Sphingomonas sp. HDW15A]